MTSEQLSQLTNANQGDVYLSSLTSLPDNVKFENQGDVYLRSLTSLPDNVKFENQGDVYLSSLTSLPDNVKFENQGSVDLRSLTSLPDNVKFENQGDVDLSSLTSLPDNVKFENQGSVDLRSLTSLPDNVKFENQGDVYLSSLTSLPDNVKFENQGDVYLRSLNGAVRYKGREIRGIVATGQGLGADSTPGSLHDKIVELQKAMQSGAFGEPEGPDAFRTEHVFAPGLYMRILHLPKGKMAVGKLHRDATLNILLSGTLLLASESTSEQVSAPWWHVSPPGTKKAVVALSDCIFANVHPNPDDGQDLELIEDRVIVPEPDLLPGPDADQDLIEERPFVFLGYDSRPFLVFRDWIHRYQDSNKNWVTFRKLRPGDREKMEQRKLPHEQAALYGWPITDPLYRWPFTDL